MICDYARVSMDGRSVGEQVRQPRAAREDIRKIARNCNISHATISRLSP
jgi:hypothetical protein